MGNLRDSRVRRLVVDLSTRLLQLLQPMERRMLREVGIDEPIAPPPVFIVGCPRSGSTVLYQVLTNCLQVDYFSNLACLFFQTPYIGATLHTRLYGARPFNRFESERGRTRGLGEPSECGKFWYRWFPRDRHFVGAHEVTAEQRAEIRQTFSALARRSGRPTVIKNLNCGQRLQALHAILPEAVFIFCRRDPVDTAHSILKAREEVLGSRDAWWSVMPRQVEELTRLPYAEQIARQVFLIDKQIEMDLQLYSAGQHAVVRFEELGRDPAGILTRVELLLAANGISVARRPGAVLPSLRVRSRDTVPEPERELLRMELERLAW